MMIALYLIRRSVVKGALWVFTFRCHRYKRDLHDLMYEVFSSRADTIFAVTYATYTGYKYAVCVTDAIAESTMTPGR